MNLESIFVLVELLGLMLLALLEGTEAIQLCLHPVELRPVWIAVGHISYQ